MINLLSNSNKIRRKELPCGGISFRLVLRNHSLADRISNLFFSLAAKSTRNSRFNSRM